MTMWIVDTLSSPPFEQRNDTRSYLRCLAGKEEDFPTLALSGTVDLTQGWRVLVGGREGATRNFKFMLYDYNENEDALYRALQTQLRLFVSWLVLSETQFGKREERAHQQARYVARCLRFEDEPISDLDWIEVTPKENTGESANPTTYWQPPETIEQEFQHLFAAARDEVFEDGMDSGFSRGLVYLIGKYGNAAFETLTSLIIGETVNPEVASEALRWLGDIEDPITYHNRLWLLERSLQSSSARVRDGAILGLASLDDPTAISYVQQSIERERIQELRRNMQQVLDQLKDTQAERM